VAPRLKAHGADLDRVKILDGIDTVDEDGRPIRRPWRMPTDLKALEAFIADQKIRLLVLDPVAYMIGGTDGNAYSEVGAVLTALRQVAENTDCCILGVRHLRKAASADARDAGIGSVAWTAVARVDLIVARDPQDETNRRRVLAQSKNNLAPLAQSLAYSIVTDAEFDVARTEWTGTCTLEARHLTAENDPDAMSDRMEARELLRVLLADGPAPAKDIMTEARTQGISERTLRKAKADLSVKSEKSGMAGSWVWRLPEGCTQDDRSPYGVAAMQPCSVEPLPGTSPDEPAPRPQGGNTAMGHGGSQ
jgi:putative DNA primase/helicase